MPRGPTSKPIRRRNPAHSIVRTMSRRQRRRASSTAPAPSEAPSEPSAPEYDLVILGAGVAGLALAARLRAEWPDKRTVLLEARSRIGGRVSTEPVAGVPVDMGAAWLHDLSRDNPLADLVRRTGVRTKVSDYGYAGGSHWDLRPDWGEGEEEPPAGVRPMGRRMPREEAEREYGTYEKFEGELNRLREELFNAEEAEDAPLADLVDAAKDALGLAGKRAAWLDELVYTSVEEVEAADCEELSALYFDEVDVDVNGGVNLLFPEGAWSLFQSLAEGLDIRLGAEAVSVTHDPRSKVVAVRTRSGESFRASTVAVTVPLGVLKADRIAFTPALPKRLRESVDKLGFGTLDKVILLFPRGALGRLLDSGSEILYLHHDADEERDGFRIVEMFALDGWTRHLAPPPEVDGLVGFVAGSGARRMEEMGEREVLDVVMGKLRRADPGLPDPVEVRITRWATDPFSLGSYSFHAPGSHPSDHDAFTAPVNGWLYFAGEHTSDVYPATMQGAYTSGLRVASQISEAWLAPTLPPSMRAARGQAAPAPLPGQISLGGLQMPASGIPESMDRQMAAGAQGFGGGPFGGPPGPDAEGGPSGKDDAGNDGKRRPKL
ncbi:flavin-containing amine oxidoreductase-domain containing protein [Hyaloraphidium curvatum]|nr:flavin-containing amine oxidoreductase-domain containing protein [Hyaloraphidium curvatum]